MWISYLKKKNLLDLLKNQEPFDIAPIVEKDELKPIFKDQDTVLLIWSSKPTKLNFFPCLICLPNNTTREFLAWVNTYIPSIKPFTAYCKVIEEENLSNSCFNDISCGNLEFLEKTIVGIIIAEILTHLENKDLKRISPIAVKSTLSYTLANSYFVGLHENLLKILNSWMKLQKISNQRPRTLSPNYIVEVWNIITSLNKIGRASCRERVCLYV